MLRECQINDFQHWMSIPHSLMTPAWTPCLRYCIKLKLCYCFGVLRTCTVNLPLNIYWGNNTTLMWFEQCLTLLLSLVLSQTWTIGYDMLDRVFRGHQRACYTQPALEIIKLTLSQYTVAITLILWLLPCAHSSIVDFWNVLLTQLCTCG